MTDLILLHTNASGPLVPSNFARSLAKVSSGTSGPDAAPRAVIHGQELRLALVLPLESAACAAFLLDFGGQGRRVKGAAHGPGAALLSWAFHTVAASLACTLFDATLGREIDASPESHRAAAVAYLVAYEADVSASRQAPRENDGAAFLAWLVREEHLALAEESGALGPALPMEDAGALYELLLESDLVEDVFVGERELASLLARFHARAALPRSTQLS